MLTVFMEVSNQSVRIHWEDTTMNTRESMMRWCAYLQSTLKRTHVYQVQALATFSFAAAQARECHLSRLSAHVPTSVQPASVLRRLKRFLNNERLDVEHICDQIASWLVRWNAPRARLLLLLDETPHHNEWRVVKVSLCHRRRSLPLVWRTDGLTGRSQEQRVLEVLEQTARLRATYAPQAEVVLLADRGLRWPAILRFCQEHGWHFVLRAQSQTHFRYRDAQGQWCETACGQLIRQRGEWFKGSGEAFKKAGWLPVNLVAAWWPQAQEPWLLVSDLNPSLHLMRWYARRMWHEQSFRDEKSHGFQWDKSQIRSSVRMHRLLLILALAQLWLSWLGEVALDPHRPWRARLGLSLKCVRRRWSIFRIGWHFLLYCLNLGLLPPYKLAFSPP